MRAKRFSATTIALCAFVAWTVSCTGNQPAVAELETSSLIALDGIAFQTPIAEEDTLTGTFEPDLTLSFEIFLLRDGEALAEPVGPGFSTTDGSIRVENEPGVAEHYIAVWHTRASSLPDGSKVRIEVRLPHAPAGAPACSVGGVDLNRGCLAFSDMTLAKPPPRGSLRDELSLRNGQSVPIKVHVEQGAVGVDGLVLDPFAPAGTVAGWYGQIRFFAAPGAEESTGGGHFRLSGRTDPVGQVQTIITGHDTGTIAYLGTVLDGYGTLTEQEKGVLEELASSPLSEMLARVPLDLACLEEAEDVLPVTGASLLMPWQMILKYLVPDRLAVIATLAEDSECGYFSSIDEPIEEREPAPAPGVVTLSRESMIPLAYGFFPFDREGQAVSEAARTQQIVREFEQILTQAIQDEFGPGGSKCRGACGPDCPDTCRRTVERVCAVRDGQPGILTVVKFNCGTHEGCREHDSCLDRCTRENPSEDIFDFLDWYVGECYRDCHLEAQSTYGMEQSLDWAGGDGPYDGYVDFEYTRDHPLGPENFAPCPPGDMCVDGSCIISNPPPPPPAPPCVACGDVHFYTPDGLNYDYQGVGEYILAESAGGDLVVQTRQKAWGSSTTVSVNSAVSMNVAGDIIGVYLDQTPSLYVNGVATEASSHFSLPLGGHVYVFPGEHRVLWPDGSVVNVRNYGSYLNVGMSLASPMREQIRGLIGNFDGDRSNDLTTRDGQQLTLPPDPYAVHGAYGDSWRIAQDESLFVYETGTDSSTFTNLAFPLRYVSVDTLTQSEYDSAKQSCQNAGVTHPVLLENCILDVAVTGDTSFAQSTSEATTPGGFFHETFELGISGAANYTDFAHWTITRGSVDLLGPGYNQNLCKNGIGMCVDLDGGTGTAARLETKELFELERGTYELSFQLGGSQRGDTNVVSVGLGTLYNEVFTLASSHPHTVYVKTIGVPDTTSARLVFDHEGGDFYGAILDNVAIRKLSQDVHLIVNGGFDLSADFWVGSNIHSGAGWQATGGNPDGHVILNASGSCASDPTLGQTVSSLVVGETYAIRGEYQPVYTSYGNPSALSFGVLVDGVPVLELARGAEGVWTPFEATFTATGTQHAIALAAERNCDDSSYRIDNIAMGGTFTP